MSASKLFSLNICLALICLFLYGFGLAKCEVNKTLADASSATFWQRLKASVMDFQWQQAKPDVESAATIQRRREMWQRLNEATVL